MFLRLVDLPDSYSSSFVFSVYVKGSCFDVHSLDLYFASIENSKAIFFFLRERPCRKEITFDPEGTVGDEEDKSRMDGVWCLRSHPLPFLLEEQGVTKRREKRVCKASGFRVRNPLLWCEGSYDWISEGP